MGDADVGTRLAQRLVGGRSIAIGWNGRTRVVVADRGAVARFEGARFAPAFRGSARLLRDLRALVASAAPRPGPDHGRSLLAEALPATLRNLRPAAAIVGTPGGSQSVVVRLDDASGRPVAVCKVAVADGAAHAIRREAAALSVLGPTGKAPRLLATVAVDGRAAIATAFVAGPPGTTGGRGVFEALAVLPSPEPGARTWPASAHPWVRRTTARHAGEAGGAALLANLDRDLPGAWPEVRTHGDLAPWNIVRTGPDTALAIDWEESDADGFVGVDLAHYVMVTARLIRRHRPAAAASLARVALVEHLGLDEAAANAIAGLTAAATADRERTNGAAPNSVTYWLEAADACAPRTSPQAAPR